MKTRLEMWVWESGPKIDPATGVSRIISWNKDTWKGTYQLGGAYQIYSRNWESVLAGIFHHP